MVYLQATSAILRRSRKEVPAGTLCEGDNTPEPRKKPLLWGGAICLLCVKPTLALDRMVEMKLLHAQW